MASMAASRRRRVASGVRPVDRSDPGGAQGEAGEQVDGAGHLGFGDAGVGHHPGDHGHHRAVQGGHLPPGVVVELGQALGQRRDELVLGAAGPGQVGVGPALEALGGVVVAVDRGLPGGDGLGHGAPVPLDEEVELVGDVAVQRVAGQPHLGGHVAQADLGVAPLGEQPHRGVEHGGALLGHVVGDGVGLDPGHRFSLARRTRPAVRWS
jgi:hypothetical protein